MNILLTGGAGYIGSACLRRLLRQGHNPIAYDNLSEGNPGSVPDASNRLVVGELADLKRLTDVMLDRKIEAVMHFAALASVPDSIADPYSYYTVNVLGTKNVLDAMRAAGVRRVVFSSTSATYGFHTEMPLRETSPQLPETPYGTTKHAAERMIKEYSRAYNFGYTLLRYFNASGADPDGHYGEDHKKEGHLIPLILFTALGRRDKVFLYGNDWPTPDGTCVRDYVHTEDLAQAHQLAIETLEPGMGRVYNLGSGTGSSLLEVLRACEKAVGAPIPHEIVGRRPGDPAILIATPEKIMKELGWAPQFPEIESITTTAWRWHSSHPKGYAGKA